MKTIFYYDENFIYSRQYDYFEGEVLPEMSTDIAPPQSLYLGKYDPEKKQWKESASQEYKESLQVELKPPEINLVKQQISDLYYLIAMGGI
ncbi:hypothetical protein [Bacillus safensis]|uniref:hypothetical protein n=1 Tax=Bacillus safensis TaxID=561879 RepID=UPI0020CDA2F3|nr:hypothetical protein [Bacillus safensis]MCP9283652.1 hypothetical protein [Bacillus safensis]